MLTGKQLKIFGVMAQQPFAEFTRKQIKRISNEKSNNALALAINLLKKEEVILEKKVGKSGLLALNLNNELTYFYLALANRQIIGKAAGAAIIRVKEEIGKITQFYSLVIFGSYAVQEQTKTSDLDIAVIIEADVKRKQVEAAVSSAKLKSILNIDAHVISKDEFIEMLINDAENLGKQIARKHLAVHNHQIFYALVMEGMRHGFRI